MADLFNADFQDFLLALHQHDVRYVLVGGYSVILHGYSRTTCDLDVWVEKSAENYQRSATCYSPLLLQKTLATYHVKAQPPFLYHD